MIRRLQVPGTVGSTGATHFRGFGELHLLQDFVSVGPEVQVLLEEIPAPVGEHLLGALLALLLVGQEY